MYSMDFKIIIDWIPQLLSGCFLTIWVSFLTFIFGSTIGIIIGTLRTSKIAKSLNYICVFYVEIFRGTPLLIQLFFIYFGLGQFGLKLEPIQAGLITFSLNTGAYVSEIVRSSISSIDKGQYEAAISVGMTHIQALRYVILPQALKISIPPLVNTVSAILKDSSLISVIAVVDLTRVGQQIYTTTFRPFEVFATIGFLYLVMNCIIAYFSRFLEKKVIL